MRKARVLLDTNILISGLIFKKGNEHRILRLIEERQITLILPETVMIESRRVLAEKFPRFEKLLDLFLERTEFESIPLDNILSNLEACVGKVRDAKDTPIYAAIVTAKPDYAVTGDKTLRSDLSSSPQASNTKACSAKGFLDDFEKQESK